MEDERYYPDETGAAPVARGAIEHSEKVDKIVPALVKAQKAIEHVGKDATAHIETKQGKDYDYSYTTLACVLNAIKGPLTENDCICVQGVATEEFEYTYYDKTRLGMKVTVTAGIYHTSGQWFECSLMMVAADTSPRVVGSVITYGRRYTVMPLVGLASEDDDGAAADMPPVQAVPKKKAGTKKQAKKETDEAGDLLKAEAAFNDAWASVMEAIGEDDADNSTALRRKFFKATTEGSNAFLAMADSTAGMAAKEVALVTAMLTKGKDRVVGLCSGPVPDPENKGKVTDWRKELGLPSLGVELCVVCKEPLSETEKASCAVAGLDPYCEKHAGDALAAKMKGATGEGV